MNALAAIELIDQAIEGIDAFHDVYKGVSGAEGPTFTRIWNNTLEVEQEKVIPQLEMVRQIALHVDAADLDVSAEPDKTSCVTRPYEANRNALLVLRTRLERKDELAAVLGPTGPKLASTSLHPTIWKGAATLFDGGHYRQAVQTAGQALEGHLQIHSGPAIGGQDLAKLFASTGSGTTTLHFAKLDPTS